jgi:chemotaxis protein MotB
VVRYLSGRGVAATRFQAVGLADTRPIASNATIGGRASNRRVEILVLCQQGAPDQSPADALGGTP